MPSRRLLSLLVTSSALCLGLALGCGRSAPNPDAAQAETPDGPEWFEDATERLGVHFTHDPGPVDKHWMYQIVGSGCAIHDLDGDNRPDLVLLTNGGPDSKSTNRLFRQKPDGTFEDVSSGSGLDTLTYCRKYWPATASVSEITTTLKSTSVWKTSGCAATYAGNGVQEFVCNP